MNGRKAQSGRRDPPQTNDSTYRAQLVPLAGVDLYSEPRWEARVVWHWSCSNCRHLPWWGCIGKSCVVFRRLCGLGSCGVCLLILISLLSFAGKQGKGLVAQVVARSCLA